jgi:hypothetical protein
VGLKGQKLKAPKMSDLEQPVLNGNSEKWNTVRAKETIKSDRIIEEIANIDL